MTRLHGVDYGAARALFEVNNSYVVVDINNSDVLSVESEKPDGSWIRVAADFEYPEVWRELAEASVAKLDVEAKSDPERERKFRVPESVKREASQSLSWVTAFGRGNSIMGEKLARMLTDSTYVTTSDVVKMQRYFSRLSYSLTEMAGWNAGSEEFPTIERIRYGMRGGDSGLAWVNKIATKHSIQASAEQDETVAASAFEYDDACTYFGRGIDPEETLVDGLYMLRPDETWATRENNDWSDIEAPAEDEILIMLDEDSAYKLADIIDDVLPEDPDALPYELTLLNPHEAALFYAAEPELDYEMIDRVFDIYDSTERSVNAKKQVRSQGGRFGDNPDDPSSTKEAQVETKARLPEALPLVPDVAALIQQYLAANGAGEAPAEEAPQPDPEEPIQASGLDYVNKLIEFADGEPTPAADAAPAAEPAQARPLYLAIVDRVDTEAVLDVVSLMAGPPPVLWKRDKGQWVQAPEIMAQLQGTQPPPVVELKDDAIVQNVLEQVDQTTSGGDDPVEEEAPGATEQNPDGSANAPKPDANPDQHPVTASTVPNFYPPTVAELQAHEERKRKVEERRFHFKPSEGSIPLFGMHGEVFNIGVFAEGGADKNRGGAEKLRRYWTRGEGGLKIGWNTPGDMTRCMKHLAKYLKGREAGYCALRHKEMTGVWPGDKKNIGSES